MGRSDPYVMPWYRSLLPRSKFDSAAILGASKHNSFTGNLDIRSCEFHDLTTNGWDINDPVWAIPQGRFDLVVCTRCPYFSRNPPQFVKSVRRLLMPGGIALIDWGLGDHWRIKPYAVGWIHDGMHEAVRYGDHTSFLFSCLWDRSLEVDPEVQKFREWIRNFAWYDDNRSLDDIVREEVPEGLAPADDMNINCMTLWSESPQLYIAATFGRK